MTWSSIVPRRARQSPRTSSRTKDTHAHARTHARAHACTSWARTHTNQIAYGFMGEWQPPGPRQTPAGHTKRSAGFWGGAARLAGLPAGGPAVGRHPASDRGRRRRQTTCGPPPAAPGDSPSSSPPNDGPIGPRPVVYCVALNRLFGGAQKTQANSNASAALLARVLAAGGCPCPQRRPDWAVAAQPIVPRREQEAGGRSLKPRAPRPRRPWGGEGRPPGKSPSAPPHSSYAQPLPDRKRRPNPDARLRPPLWSVSVCP